MRFDTYRISTYLVNAWQSAFPRIQVHNDGGDIIHLHLDSGESILVYLVEDGLSVENIHDLLDENTKDGHYTLFILWEEYFLPKDATHYRPNDWMSAFIALYGNKIYGFDPYGGDQIVFPVYFHGGQLKRIEHGAPINPTLVHPFEVTLRVNGRSKTWRVADFELNFSKKQSAQKDALLQVALEIMGLANHPAPLTLLQVKRAYRKMARLYHPDINRDKAAVQLMQQLNDAYAQVMKSLGY